MYTFPKDMSIAALEKITQMTINNNINKLIMIYAYSGILYNNENERPLHIKHGWIIKTMLKRNKMQKNYILYDLFYMESIKGKI